MKKNIATVEKDKVKIDETIESIDRHKRDELQTTWAKVNMGEPSSCEAQNENPF